MEGGKTSQLRWIQILSLMRVSGSEQSLPVRDLYARSWIIDVQESSLKQCRTSRLITQVVQVNKRGENKENKGKKAPDLQANIHLLSQPKQD